MSKISTKELIELLKKESTAMIEASLNNGLFNSTHYIYWDDELIHDEGCDDEEYSCTEEQWLNYYPNALWIVNQINGVEHE